LKTNVIALHMVADASSKYYLIGRDACVIHIKHGRANLIDGKFVPATEHKRLVTRISENAAVQRMREIVLAKTKKGYLKTAESMRPKLNVFAPKTKRKQSKKRNLQLSTVRNQIRHIEGFDVKLMRRGEAAKRAIRSDFTGLPNYTGRYMRQLPGTRSVLDWIRLRFIKHYGNDIVVAVLDGEGQKVKPSTKLHRVRATYAG
jgi:predicted DNA-binding WGR domain protein